MVPDEPGRRYIRQVDSFMTFDCELSLARRRTNVRRPDLWVACRIRKIIGPSLVGRILSPVQNETETRIYDARESVRVALSSFTVLEHSKHLSEIAKRIRSTDRLLTMDETGNVTQPRKSHHNLVVYVKRNSASGHYHDLFRCYACLPSGHGVYTWLVPELYVPRNFRRT
jgi:hypothetical protein